MRLLEQRMKDSKDEFLFILRNSVWDIPKGHLEKDEDMATCALREVQEECGISNHEIQKYLCTTYHTYEIQGRPVLKETHWYLMHGELINPVPQLEEGITEVVWKSKDELDAVKTNTSANIKLVLDAAGI